MSKKRRANVAPAAPAADLKSENLELLAYFPRMAIYICIGLILFAMPLYIDIDLKHVFNTAKEILFGRILMFGLVAWAVKLALSGSFPIPKTRAWYFYAATIVFMILSIGW